MSPLSLTELPVKQIKAVFTDLDGTLTSGQSLLPKTFAALEDLKSKGFWTVIVSGRPAGWADCMMRLFPIDAMIFENGAGFITREGEKLKVTATEGKLNTAPQPRLYDLFNELRIKIPALKLASDQPYRRYDVAIDFAEEPPFLTEAQISEVLTHLSAQPEVTAKLSSIHVNYWMGKHTKITACEKLIATEGKLRSISENEIIFCGDSPNDEPMFARFTHTVGVANIQPYLAKMKSHPRYLTKLSEGQGFQEISKILLSQAR